MALVCLCNGVSDSDVRRAIADGASTIDEVGERCGAGTCCSGCHPTIAAMLAERRVDVRPRLIAS